MKILKTIIVLIVLNIGYAAYGQNDYKQMIAKIDSISKADSIIKGKVKILFVTTRFDNTETEQKSLTNVDNFHFDGPFLVIEDKYFNLNKLLYFYIEDGVLEFLFQGY